MDNNVEHNAQLGGWCAVHFPALITKMLQIFQTLSNLIKNLSSVLQIPPTSLQSKLFSLKRLETFSFSFPPPKVIGKGSVTRIRRCVGVGGRRSIP